jgi:hypothetical protein
MCIACPLFFYSWKSVPCRRDNPAGENLENDTITNPQKNLEVA